MLTRSFGLALRSIVGALIASCMFASVGFAQLSDSQMQSAEQQFLANPAQFLATTTLSAGDLAAVVQALAATPANLPTIVAALANASPSQQTAMGQGLGNAAAAAQQSNPGYANQIQTAVAASGSQQASSGFSASTGGTQIASTGGAGAGGAGGGGTGGGGGGAVGASGGTPSGGTGGGGSSGTGGSQQTGTSGTTQISGGSVSGSGSSGSSGSVSP